MYKQVLSAGLLLAAATSFPAFAADNDADTLSFGGDVENTCVLDPLTQVSASNASLAAGATGSAATIDFTGFADTGTAEFVAGSGIALQMSGYCNYPHQISMQTANGSLQHQTTANQPVAGSGTFISEVHYDVNVFGWDGAFIQLDAQGVAGTKSTGVSSVAGAFRGQANMTISLTNPGPDPLLAGTWSDTLTLQIGQPL